MELHDVSYGIEYWDAEVYYDTTTGVTTNYSNTTSALSAQIKVLGKQTAYTIQSVQHQPGPSHPNTIYYLDDYDESDEDGPSEVLDIQKPIHSLSGNLTPSSDSVVESLYPLPTPCEGSDSLVEETNILLSHFNYSLPDYETFYFDIEEKSGGSTTSHSNHSLPEYESFYFDVHHIKEKSSGSTTTHSDLSLLEYESFHFDLSIDPFPPVDWRDFYHEEFADELAHIISPPEYDHFYFDIEDGLVELTRLFKENIYETSPKDLTCHELNDLRLLLSDLDSIFSEIEFPEIDLLVSFPSENENKVFDPRILIIDEVFSEVVRFDPFLSLTQSVSMTRVMETSSSGFHHMPSPRPAAYTPKEVMYCYFHPHLTSGDGLDHGPKMK
ncbi:hypothetical protein Tco_1432543 [Tanacetum coccineum]